MKELTSFFLAMNWYDNGQLESGAIARGIRILRDVERSSGDPADVDPRGAIECDVKCRKERERYSSHLLSFFESNTWCLEELDGKEWDFSQEVISNLMKVISVGGDDQLEYSEFLAASMPKKQYMSDCFLK